MKRFLAPIAIALLATSCAAPASSPGPAEGTVSAAAEATPTPTTLPAGKFKMTTLSGAEITFTLPTPVTDPKVKALEAFRVKADAAPVSYLVADVDNRKGTERINMYQVNAFDAEGREYTFSSVAETVMYLWKPTYTSDYKYKLPNGKVLDEATGSALSSEGSALYDASLNDAEVSEKATFVLTSKAADLPKEFTRVSVQPSGGGEGEDAQPAS